MGNGWPTLGSDGHLADRFRLPSACMTTTTDTSGRLCSDASPALDPETHVQRPIRWALVDGWRVSRTAVERQLRPEVCLEWIGSFDSGLDALDTLPGLEPDVVLMELELPDMDGIEGIARLKALCPKSEILVLTTHDHPEAVIAAFRAGATGYLVKDTIDTPRNVLREAILDLRRGGFPLSSSLTRKVLELTIERPCDLPSLAAMGLTLREQEVLSALARGLRYKEIAHELAISPHTVRAHIHSIYDKLQVRTKAKAIEAFRPRKLPPRVRPDREPSADDR